MVNSKEFAGRLEAIMAEHELSASAFAKKIGVQPSSISHLLSGRNKPSLDFVLKVIETFPGVELYWLLNGRGSFPGAENQAQVREAPEANPASSPAPSDKKIERVLICYTDGTVTSYYPS